MPEMTIMQVTVTLLAAGTLYSLLGVWGVLHHEYERHALLLLGFVTALLAVAIALRWIRIGHGPFVTMFEILLSNVFSIGLVYLVAALWVPAVRHGIATVYCILLVLAAWALAAPTTETPLPPTYHNAWLWAHVTVGKLFLGVCVAAVGLATILLLRLRHSNWWCREDNVVAADRAVWRLMMLAFVFHSLMLIAGAAWAQDAWGRYWAWDPLETWSLLTWCALAITLHLRVTFSRLPQAAGWSLVIGVFGLAFLTFFGVPFVSVAPHKGAM